MDYEIEGTFKVSVKLDVHADNEEAAKELAKNQLKDYYRLDVHGAHHIPDEVELDLEVFESS